MYSMFTFGLPPSSDLTLGAFRNDVSLRGQADLGDALVKLHWAGHRRDRTTDRVSGDDHHQCAIVPAHPARPPQPFLA